VPPPAVGPPRSWIRVRGRVRSSTGGLRQIGLRQPARGWAAERGELRRWRPARSLSPPWSAQRRGSEARVELAAAMASLWSRVARPPGDVTVAVKLAAHEWRGRRGSLRSRRRPPVAGGRPGGGAGRRRGHRLGGIGGGDWGVTR
jgi:hypothetical protein